MKILSVTARNFRSYPELNWTLKENGLTLIDGINPDTGRSNMAGKSTLCDSIAWCLYGFLPKWGGLKGGPVDAVIRRGEESCTVAICLEHNGKRISVSRARPLKLKVFEDWKELPGKAADLDARIPELIGMTAEQFLLACYISQDRKRSFFGISDNDRTELLSALAGLDHLNRALDRAKALKAGLQEKIQTEQGAILALSAQLLAQPEKAQHYLTKQAEAKELVASTRAKAEELQYEVRIASETLKITLLQEENSLKEAHDLAFHALNMEFTTAAYERTALKETLTEVLPPEPELEVAVCQAQIAYDQAKAHNWTQTQAIAQNLVTRHELKALLAQLDDTRAGHCNACGQTLPDFDPAARMEKLITKCRALEGKLQLEGPQVDIEPLQKALQDAKVALQTRTKELSRGPEEKRRQILAFDEKLVQIREKTKLLDQKLEMDLAKLEGKRKDLDRENVQKLEQAWRAQELAQAALKGIENTLYQIELDRMELEGKIKVHQEKVQALQKELDEALDLIDLFGPKGYRAVCFDGLISRISARAGELFLLMTDNVYSTRIEQMAENGKGEERLCLRPGVSRGGLDVPLDDLSGGARRMCMLSYDIAMAEAVHDGPLFLDEALDGLDAQGKAEALRALEEVARTRPVYLIDHGSELIASVQNVLRVAYQGGASRLES